MFLKLRIYIIILFGIAWLYEVQCNDKDYNDCSFIYWKMDWKSAVATCESDNKQLLCYKSKKEMDDITEAFRLAAFGSAELELWLSGKNCSEPQVMDECLILHIRKTNLKLWHYFRQDCTKKYPFVCCVKENVRPSSTTTAAPTTTASTITSAEIVPGKSTSTTSTTVATTSTTSTTVRPDFCKKVHRRGIEWPETPVGEVAVVPCPGNSTGKARWLCKGSERIKWDKNGPNLRNCRSLDMQDLKNKFNTSTLQHAMSLLEKVFSDHEQEIFGEDLADVIAMMTSLPHRFLTATQFQPSPDRWTATKSLIEKSASLFDRIIELNETWHDIAEERRPIAGTHLLSTIDEMGLILADAMVEGIREQSVIGKNMAMQVLRTQRGEPLQLPQWEVTSGYSHRGNVMLEQGYDARLRPEEGNISVLFTLYSDLTSIFSSQEAQNKNNSSGILNSAVVSATVSQNRKPRPISRPVRILMEHLLPKPNDSACVFWNMQRNEWDTEGCRVESGNDTYSLCVCNHLTNFALLMDYQGLLDDVDQRPFHYITLVGCVLSIVCLAVCVVVFSCYSYHSKHAWGLRYTIHRNLCIALLIANLLLVVGLDRTDSPVFLWLLSLSVPLSAQNTMERIKYVGFRKRKVPFGPLWDQLHAF
ncbi:adhesion G protein-coupled receptor L3-like [Argiope bruennichi]|uniref:adhesion G protein-coupled receptor L3-like n=1 Tax=Argiope bruennichi TaxID=94029 RepID=UPI002494C4D5|nr:adhesion G protein-coupled receptor L3-like [Argiope bruennichi]